MYNASENYKNTVRSDCRCWSSRLDFGTFFVDSAEAVALTRGSQSGEGITVGAVIAPAVKITLTSLDRELSGRSFVWRLGVLPADRFTGDNTPEDFEYIPMGSFTVKSVRRTGLKYELTCEHKLAKSDTVHSSALSFPTTAQALAEEVCNSLGLTFTQTLTPAVTVEGLPEGATKRDILGWVAALYGGFISSDRADGVSVKWYGDSAYTVPLNAISEPETGEQQITCTAVVCAAGDKTYTYGSGTAMSFACPLMTAERFEIVARQLAGYTYRPCRLSYLLGDPLIDPWDTVTLEYDGETYTIPAAELTLEHKGGVTGSLTAKEGSSGTAVRTDPITRMVSRLTKLISDNKDEIELDIAAAVAEATAELRGGAGGYFYIIGDADGTNKETIWCDNKDPALATHGIRINTAGIGFWVKDPDDPESTLFNGPYTMAWTMNGILYADFIKAGVLSGIEIICTQGRIGGWEITEDAIISPDGSVRLDSTREEPLTTHADLRENSYQHSELRGLTHREIRYILSRTVGKAQISASKDGSEIYMRDAALTVESAGRKSSVFDGSGMTLYDGGGKYFGFVGRHDDALRTDMGSAARIEWTAGGDTVLIFDKRRGLLTFGGDITVGNVNAGDITSGDIAAGNIAAGEIKGSILRVKSEYGQNSNVTIEDHGGLNIYDPNDVYMGGMRAQSRYGEEGIMMTLPANTDFAGLWRQYDSWYAEELPIAAWYRQEDHILINSPVLHHGSLSFVTGVHDDFAEGTTIDYRAVIVKYQGDEVGRLDFGLTDFGPTDTDVLSLDMIAAEADRIRWRESNSTVWEYVSSSSKLNAYRDIDMQHNALLNADISSSSDERLKDNITDCGEDCLAVINALRLIGFDWKDGEHENIGFSAQQVKTVSPDLTGENGGYMTVREGRLIRYLVGAVQQLSQFIMHNS